MKGLKFILFFIVTGLFCITIISALSSIIRGSYIIIWGFLLVFNQDFAHSIDIIFKAFGLILLIPLYFICLPWFSFAVAKRKVLEHMDYDKALIDALKRGSQLLGKIPIIGKLFRISEMDWDKKKSILIEELLNYRNEKGLRMLNESLGKQFFLDQSRLALWEKDLYFITSFYNEITQGGIFQFFSNHSGDFTDETLAALQNIQADYFVGYLKEAITVFPNETVPREIEERERILSFNNQYINEKWHTIDDTMSNNLDDFMNIIINSVEKYYSSENQKLDSKN